MKRGNEDFQYSDSPEPHQARTKQILAKYPQVRKLITRNPSNFLLIILIVGLQLTIAFLLREQPWWQALIVAFLVGAFANHALYVLIHEAAHNLIFKRRELNLIADIPNVVPGSVSFQTYHLKHHSYQGDYYFDADLPYKWEVKFEDA